MIKQAPISFLLVCIISLALSFFFVRWVYQERLGNRDDLIAYYREKLGLQTNSKTQYSGMKNVELKKAVFTLVPKVRELSRVGLETDPSDFLSAGIESLEAKTEEEKRQIWIRQAQESGSRRIRIMNQVVATYTQQYKSDVILLRDEMLLRLPPEKRANLQPLLGDDVVNPLVIEKIADKLEQIAKLLPESGS